MTEPLDQIRTYWDDDAATYDQATGHHPQSPSEWAAWSAVLRRLLPTPPARVLDVGAGTGFLTLLTARLGYDVTAVDLSEGMLTRLRAKATTEGLPVTVVQSAADQLPEGSWDAVVSRHLLWTLPDPGGALRAWRAATGDGRLLLLESLWGPAADGPERARARGRLALRRLRGTQHDHHAEYDEATSSALPLSGGTTPERLVDLVAEASWLAPRLERLRDLEWVASRQLPWPDRLLGVTPRFAVSAGR